MIRDDLIGELSARLERLQAATPAPVSELADLRCRVPPLPVPVTAGWPCSPVLAGYVSWVCPEVRASAWRLSSAKTALLNTSRGGLIPRGGGAMWLLLGAQGRGEYLPCRLD
jgi:hypothetical protein